MNRNDEKFIQSNSPDGGFLQSEEWRKFQEVVGRKTSYINFPHPDPLPEGEGGIVFSASIIEHSLPMVGNYFYIPRGPIIQSSAFSFPDKSGNFSKPSFSNLITLAKKNNVGWVRIEPNDDKLLEILRHSLKLKIRKAPHDMQPREILVMDITKPEEELLAGMKQKTRYNIKLAEKKNINVISNQLASPSQGGSTVIDKRYIDEFIRLVKITAQRDGITPHPDEYYRKMFEVIPSDIIKLYVAEYEGKLLAANIMIFYGNTCTYLHGASSDEHRELMAPYLLQWRAIQDAKKAGCEKYDFGGVKTYCIEHKTGNKNNWSGITRFKTGFTPKSEPTIFPGSYDIVINPAKYYLYIFLQKFRGVIS